MLYYRRVATGSSRNLGAEDRVGRGVAAQVVHHSVGEVEFGSGPGLVAMQVHDLDSRRVGRFVRPRGLLGRRVDVGGELQRVAVEVGRRQGAVVGISRATLVGRPCLGGRREGELVGDDREGVDRLDTDLVHRRGRAVEAGVARVVGGGRHRRGRRAGDLGVAGVHRKDYAHSGDERHREHDTQCLPHLKLSFSP